MMRSHDNFPGYMFCEEAETMLYLMCYVQGTRSADLTHTKNYNNTQMTIIKSYLSILSAPDEEEMVCFYFA